MKVTLFKEGKIFQEGGRKLLAYFTSIGVYLILMLVVIIVLRPGNLSLESFALSLASGIMVISYGFYASNAYVHAKEGKQVREGKQESMKVGKQDEH